MQKIKITSNSPIIKPQSLENIDVSFGVSYFSSQDQDVKVIENDWGFEVGNTSGCYRFFIARYGRRDKRAGDWATYRVQPVPILAAGTRFVQFGKGGKQIVGKPDDLWALSGGRNGAG